MLRSTLSHLTLVPNDIPDSGAKASARTGRIWIRLRKEAEEAVVREPMLARLFFDSIINQPTLEEAVAHRIGSRLHNDVLPSSAITYVLRTAMAADKSIGEAMRADIRAAVERDPACDRFIEPFLYYKGFHAIQTQRLAHWLWNNNGRDFALYLQSRSSDVFQTDIHPAASFGRGIFLDHATGLVVGATAVVEDDVSLLQNVTLGGTGKEAGDRHPKVRRGAVIGAGAKILGNIEIGAEARVAAGSVVLRRVAPSTTVAGVPARQVAAAKPGDSPHEIDQLLNAMSVEALTYSI